MQRTELFDANVGRYRFSVAWYGLEWALGWVCLGSKPCSRYRLDLGPFGFRFGRY